MKAMNPLSSKNTTTCPPPNPVGSCMLIHFSSTLCDPMDYSPPGSSVHGDSPDKNTGVGCYSLLQRIFPTQGLSPGLLYLWHWQVDSLPAEPAGKPKNTGMGSLFLSPVYLPNPRIKPGSPAFWGILYQLSYQEIPKSNPLRLYTEGDK